MALKETWTKNYNEKKKKEKMQSLCMEVRTRAQSTPANANQDI